MSGNVRHRVSDPDVGLYAGWRVDTVSTFIGAWVREARMGRLAVVVMGVLCLGAAGGVYVIGIQQPAQAWDSAETVEGTITATDVETSSSDAGSAYSPVVTYEYDFDGQTYTNDRLALLGGVGFETPSGAEDYLESFAAGDSVTVYVVPASPSESFLERGSAGLVIYGIIGFFALVGLLCLFAAVADLYGVEAVNIKV